MKPSWRIEVISTIMWVDPDKVVRVPVNSDKIVSYRKRNKKSSHKMNPLKFLKHKPFSQIRKIISFFRNLSE